jgi:glycosyltransferase involved in cell wall biosynthesis
MHVAIVCRGLGAGGSVAAVALRQARELARHARVTLISDSLPDDFGGLGAIRVRVPDFHALRRLRHVPDEVVFARASRQALQKSGPVDFVLCHSHSAAYLAARRIGVPFGFFVHGDITDRPKGMYDPRLTKFYRWVTPRAYRTADVVFVLAPYFVEVAQRGGARRVELVPNGIDPAEIGLLEESAVGGRRSAGMPLRVLSVGRLSVEKGIEQLVDAVALLGDSVALTIVGEGPLAPVVQGRATLLGPRPRASLGAIYRQHDVFCTAAVSETFGLVIAEALVSGLPVVATRTGGIPLLVEHEHNGLLVPPGDPRALADALATLARDETFRSRLAENARASVLPRFAWPAIGDRIAEIIRTMRA